MRAFKAIGAPLLVAGISIALIGAHGLSEQSAAVVSYERLSREVSTAVDGDSEDDSIDWESLLAANPDVAAWCRVEGTSINLPVCQASDDNPEFWLSHDLWGNDSPVGTLYIDHRAIAESQHILCYGHHLMGIGGMLSELYRCNKQDEFDRVLTGDLIWSTPDGKTTKLHPLCASIVDKDKPDIQSIDFGSVAELRLWLKAVVAQSTARTKGATAFTRKATRAITLVTCSSDMGGQRGRTIITFTAMLVPPDVIFS